MQTLVESIATAWPGRISNADPGDLPKGAAVEQDNWESLIPGRLTGRKGKRPVTFAAASGATATADITAMTASLTGRAVTVYYANDAGEIIRVINPT